MRAGRTGFNVLHSFVYAVGYQRHEQRGEARMARRSDTESPDPGVRHPADLDELARAKTEATLYVGGAAAAGPKSDGQRVDQLRRSDPALDKKMTLAARSGNAKAEADAASLEEDLAELDAWEAQNRDQP